MSAHQTTVDFHCPYTRRSIELLVKLVDASGELLDTPLPVEVTGFMFRRPGRGGEWEPAIYPPECYFENAAHLLSWFLRRLHADPDLRRWLRQITFPAAFGTSPEPEAKPWTWRRPVGPNHGAGVDMPDE